jgi:hypothetical protein
MPSTGQWMTGIGVPQKRWREMPQSFRRYCVERAPMPLASAASAMRRHASSLGRPENSPELIDRP